MAKVLVIYYSRYGTTKKYAEWIASELDGEICDLKNARKLSLENYDTIILGSSLYAGNIQGINVLVNNYENIKDKKLLVFSCGLADVTVASNIEEINNRIEANIPQDYRSGIKIFNLRGGMDFKNLSLKHKFMMWLLNKVMMHKPSSEVTQENLDFIASYGKKADYTDKSKIAEIVAYCRE